MKSRFSSSFESGPESRWRIDDIDWSSTPLGPRSQWSQPLRTSVELMAGARRPMVATWGTEWTLIYNAAFASLLGEEHPGAAGRSFGEVFADRIDVDAVREQLRGGNDVDVEGVRLPGAGDGVSSPLVRFRITPLHDKSGEVRGALMHEFDPVEVSRRDVEADATGGEDIERLKRSEQRFRAIFEYVEQAVGILEILFNDAGEPVDCRFVEVNSIFEEHTGLENPVGKRARQLVPDADPQWFETYGDVVRNREPARLENFEPALGRWYDVHAFPVEEPDKNRVGLLFNDITERKYEEANTELIAEIHDDFSKLTHFEEIAQSVADKLMAHLDVSRVAFVEIDEEGERTVEIHDYHRPGMVDVEGSYRLSDYMEHDDREALLEGQPVVADDVTTHPGTADYAEAYETFGIASKLLVPHHSDGRLKFIISVYHSEPYQWRDDEVELMCDLAPQLWYRLERAQAEQELRESQRRFHRALDAANMVAWEREEGSDQVYTFPRPEATEGLPFYTGADSLQMAQQSIHPDDRDECRRRRRRAMETDEKYTITYRYRHPDDDQWCWIEETGRAVDKPDGGRWLVGVARDITEQKRTEDRLAEVTAESKRLQRLHEAIMSGTPDLQYVFGLDYRIQYANRALLEMWGKSWDEAIGERLINLGYPEWHAEMHEREIDQIVETKEPVRGEVPYEGPLGRRIYDYIMVPVIDEDGEVEAVAGTTRDVSERKRAEEALKEADRRKNRFLGVLSHELRNPLAPITVSLHLLENAEPGSEREQRARRVIERQTDQLTRLVDDLLDVTRITRDKIELQRERVELNELAKETVEDHLPVFDERETELQFEPADRSIIVDGDPNRLAQVIGNLLQNASKYTDAGGHARLSLDTDADAGYAEIRVVDDGIGMDEQTLKTLFEPFAQADVAIKDSEGGLGLGLALVKGLVDLHGGTVDVHSEGPGEGTEFIVRLPAAFESQSESLPSEVETMSESLDILLIEDNEDIATSLQLVLQDRGHSVAVASDGNSGVDQACQIRPDVVICDIGLPGMNGFEVAEAIHAEIDGEPPCLIALTGYASDEDIQRAEEVGFERHLAKPPDLAELTKILKEIRQGQ